MSDIYANSNNRDAMLRPKVDQTMPVAENKQIAVQRILHKLKSTFLKGVTKLKGQQSPPQRFITETVLDQQDSDEADLLRGLSCSMFENAMEKNQCRDLVTLIKQALASLRENDFCYEILIPCGLVTKVARDVMELARDEPCGLRGCVLFINLEDKKKCQNLVKLVCDPMTVSTFEVYLTLKEDMRGWCMFKKFFISMSGHLDKNKKLELKLLSSTYQLLKKKLYRLSN